MNTALLMPALCIWSKERQQRLLEVLHNSSHLQQRLVQELAGQQGQLVQVRELEQEWEVLEVWEEQELIPSLEWGAWVECRCSLVWLQVVAHLESEAWAVQTWTLRWLTR